MNDIITHHHHWCHHTASQNITTTVQWPTRIIWWQGLSGYQDCQVIYLKQDVLEVASWTGMGVDARNQHILISIQATVDGLQLFNNLYTKKAGCSMKTAQECKEGLRACSSSYNRRNVVFRCCLWDHSLFRVHEKSQLLSCAFVSHLCHQGARNKKECPTQHRSHRTALV